jgi:uncharacterized membrane protein YfcA
MPHLSALQWILAAVGGTSLGLAKAGLAGMGLVYVVIFAFLFGAKSSTGVALPMLLVGDAFAVTAYHRHANWKYVWRMLPPAFVGVMIGAAMMGSISDAAFRPTIGWIILALSAMQVARMRWPDWLGDVPHTWWFVWGIGLLAGVTTMLANAAGPIILIYCLAVSLPKFEMVGTSAWFFAIVNAFKVPFSVALGLIGPTTLLLNALLVPFVLLGVLSGRWLIYRIPQRAFEVISLAFAAIAALRLIGV